ncbi:putative pentatricopeptide repeat-containing protein At5g43820 [Nicotiana tomentosiformis]|uniref:putative pentatricopeptide repeat-containing protein At5g43820 n=1 Tax=Nicotiana tomentosiformis TaxID=4098 RepID=UPI00051AEFBE|nr:putative pentatricopeptide repeat-containing protein At5g43820 [Nicotiana tomentosiformis]XP_009604612.1 putative pentatricopeptide repeat-containing protein At5g43820 [Nicotiana tomentosiformis]XP_009604613.1 putative pentatricopeptide repeat-containing protein At5g43820 [Nicotiana tomentosiformis]XP_009604614.1 putative pentatricopeptide repeat-containing protein At5g43820 [Nicotiana tomentosiformis]XP_009604615.1 putative pentatricopeptide repeat-containing protein At5g43820 [Nicotiana to
MLLARFLASRSTCLSISSLIPAFYHSFSSLPNSQSPETFSSNFDESHVLNQLSDLLPIRQTPLTEKPFPTESSDQNNQLEVRVLDELLTPEDKLRGIFLPKLQGKTAIDKALTSVDVELTVDLVAKVVNRGNLDAASMVTFFNWAIKQQKIPIDNHTYCIILKALGRRKFFKHMVEMLEDMRSRGIIPNLDTLYIVVDSFVRARRISKAIELFSGLEDYGLKCNTETLNVVLQCLCCRSHVGAASSLLVKMKAKVSFDVSTFNIVIGGWSRFGRVKEVERILKEMVDDGFEANNLTYSYLLECLGRAGRIDESVEIFEGLEEKGCVLDAAIYNAMISNFISHGEIDESVKYYGRMLNTGCEPNADTYMKLISAFLKARRVADAIEMFDEMLSRGMIVTTGTLTSFLEPLCSYGPPHAALMIYKKARQAGCRISLTAYKLLLMRLSRFGKCGMLLNIWNEMQESGYSSDMQIYEYVINGLCNIGQLENAVLVMEEALQKGFYPSRLIYSKLNNKLLASNKIEIAYKLFLKIKVARGNHNSQSYWRAKGWHF